MLLIKTTDHMYYHTHVYAYVGIKYKDCGFMGYVYIKYNDGGFKVKFTRTGRIFDRLKIRAFRIFVHTKSRKP